VWFLLLDEFPDRFFGLGFRDAVGDVGVIGRDGIIDGQLCLLVRERGWKVSGRTGSHSELLRTRVSLGSPVVRALTEPVTAMALTLLPYSLALFRSSRALSSH